MNLRLRHSEPSYLPKPLKMIDPKLLSKGQSFHPQAYSTCNRQWLRNAMIGSKSSNRESLKKVRRFSKSTQFLLHREKNRRSSKPLPSPTPKSLTSTTSKSPKRLREEELVKERPLTPPEHHMILPDRLQDHNQELPLSIQMRRSRRRKKSMNLTYPGPLETNCLELSSDPSYSRIASGVVNQPQAS